MKKFLSIILTAMLIVGMLPTAFAEDVVENPKYAFSYSAHGKTENVTVTDFTTYETIDKSVSTGSWKYVSRLGDVYSTMELQQEQLQYSVKSVDPVNDNALLLMLKVDASGTYVPTVGFGEAAITGRVDLYMVKTTDVTAQDYAVQDINGIMSLVGDASYDADAIVKHICSVDTNSSSVEPEDTYAEKLELEAGEYYLISVISKGEVASNHSKGRTYCNFKFLDLMKQSTGDEEEMETVSGNVSFGAYCDVPNAITVTGIEGYISNNQIDSVPVGSTIKAVANTTNPKYIFRGWKRGSRDYGVWLTTDTTVEFPIMTNTFLSAVYEPVADEDTVNVEFYNYNGQYLDTAENVANMAFSLITKPDATLTGYGSPFWTIDGVSAVSADAMFKKLTRVVANYKAKESFKVTIGDMIEGAITNTYAYDTELELKSASKKAGTWYVNEKPVANGASYKHCVWDTASITFVEEETAAPIISLDAKVKENGARMISYDANGKDIVEVGILFGENASVASFSGKAASKAKGDVQGQFTAMPNSDTISTARGYMIYEDNGTYRVIYSK
ncbi:MAG: hypothetical protein IJP38_06045 [Oscillospiraceae bacterium]|nr:hypothetical protein [Oscillospiraceae bacterium]MBQ9985852.1 hypothetical protein [Oscillospiraceae bacterium]